MGLPLALNNFNNTTAMEQWKYTDLFFFKCSVVPWHTQWAMKACQSMSSQNLNKYFTNDIWLDFLLQARLKRCWLSHALRAVSQPLLSLRCTGQTTYFSWLFWTSSSAWVNDSTYHCHTWVVTSGIVMKTCHCGCPPKRGRMTVRVGGIVHEWQLGGDLFLKVFVKLSPWHLLL